MSIMRQADQYAGFGPPTLSRRAAEERPDLPPAAHVADFLGGRRVAVDTHFMNPDSHAYHTEDSDIAYSPGPGRDWDPNTGYQPSDHDEYRREQVGEDDDSGYNWGHEPHFDPGSEPGPHPDFHGDAPHPFGTPTFQPHPADPGSRLGFNQARHHTADGQGNAGQEFGLPDTFNPNIYFPGQQMDEKSQMLGTGDDPARWPTASRPNERVAHGYFPSNRVGLPYKDQIIPGTVTHLDGMNVGIRWDDGQHSSEDPLDIRPL